MVRQVSFLAGQPEARLVHLARSGPDGGPPNNWAASFGGGEWEWDERTEQYYYHAYLPEQPDLNWRNPEVQRDDPRSMLALHRRLLDLRRAEPALSVGSYVPVEATDGVLAYHREHADKRFLIALNLGSEPRRFVLDGRGHIARSPPPRP